MSKMVNGTVFAEQKAYTEQPTGIRMATLQRELRRRLHAFMGPLIGLSLICYFVYHAIQGDRGFLSWARLSQKLEVAEAELAGVQSQRAALEDLVSRLNPSHLDLDLLEQQVRRILGMHHPDELVIMETPQKNID